MKIENILNLCDLSHGISIFIGPAQYIISLSDFKPKFLSEYTKLYSFIYRVGYINMKIYVIYILLLVLLNYLQRIHYES